MMLLAASVLGLMVVTGADEQPMICTSDVDSDVAFCNTQSTRSCEGKGCQLLPTDRIRTRFAERKRCLDKNRVQRGKSCEVDGDCVCGDKCYKPNDKKPGQCKSCEDFAMPLVMGKKKDCDKAMEHGFECTWSATMEDPSKGMCITQGNECMDLMKDQCKDSPICKYNKVMRSCEMAYVPSCHAEDEVTYRACASNPLRDMCAENEQCSWGFDSRNSDLVNHECLLKLKEERKSCRGQSDCSCGSRCMETRADDDAKCYTCGMLETQKDCESDAAARMNCKWLGSKKDGPCVRDEPCQAISDKEECEANDRCEYSELHQGTGVTCFKMKVKRKQCKHLGKIGDADEEEKIIACNSEPNCEWNSDQQKCRFRRSWD